MVGALKALIEVAETHPSWVAALLFAGALVWVTRQWLRSMADVLDLAKQFASTVETQNQTNRELLEHVDRLERRLDRVS